jgi:predicted house-cleaning NTP pyrophosphatase (Maf/HAM1 superfamily)
MIITKNHSEITTKPLKSRLGKFNGKGNTVIILFIVKWMTNLILKDKTKKINLKNLSKHKISNYKNEGQI